MKYPWLLFIVVICGLVYVRSEQQQVWNTCLDDLKAPQVSASAIVAASSGETPPPAAVPPTDTPTLNPDGVKQDEQPVQPKANGFHPPDPLPAQPNWTWTVLHRDYHNVIVTKVEADSVSIMYDGGVGRINTSDLPPDLQRMMNYDPQAAAQASQQKAAALAQAEAAQAPALAALKQHEQEKKALADADDAKSKLDAQNKSAEERVSVTLQRKKQLEDERDQIVKSHEVYLDSNGTILSGIPFWVSRYEDDIQGIAQCDLIINSGGK